jgi:hypothetical protein
MAILMLGDAGEIFSLLGDRFSMDRSPIPSRVD